MNNERLQRVQSQFQQDLAEIFRHLASEHYRGLLLTPTAVRVAPDLSIARVLVSVFPGKNHQDKIDWLNNYKGAIKDAVVKRSGGQLRKMPDLAFHLDDSFDQQEQLDKIFREGGESPIK